MRRRPGIPEALMFVLGNRRQLNVVSCAPAYPRATAMAGWIKDQEVGIRCRRDMLDQGKGRLGAGGLDNQKAYSATFVISLLQREAKLS